jgi:hypothetical protein
MKPRIEPETVTAIYKSWLRACGLDGESLSYWSNDIHRVNLSFGNPKHFDEYVWGCGGRIYQENGKRYIEFFEDSNLTMFLLKWL